MTSASSGLQMMSWRVYTWPAWVPASVRAQAEDVWKTPLAWRHNATVVGAPAFGSVLQLSVDGTVIAGRYVHLRGLTGRVVARDAINVVYVVTLDQGQPKVLRR